MTINDFLHTYFNPVDGGSSTTYYQWYISYAGKFAENALLYLWYGYGNYISPLPNSNINFTLLYDQYTTHYWIMNWFNQYMGEISAYNVLISQLPTIFTPANILNNETNTITKQVVVGEIKNALNKLEKVVNDINNNKTNVEGILGQQTTSANIDMNNFNGLTEVQLTNYLNQNKSTTTNTNVVTYGDGSTPLTTTTTDNSSGNATTTSSADVADNYSTTTTTGNIDKVTYEKLTGSLIEGYTRIINTKFNFLFNNFAFYLRDLAVRFMVS